MKKTKSEKSKRKTQTRREKQEEKGREKDEIRYTLKRCLKRKRVKSVKNAKNKTEHIVSKREKSFLAHEKVLAQDQGGEKHFLFFKKKKRKVEGKVYQNNAMFFLFSFFGRIFYNKN